MEISAPAPVTFNLAMITPSLGCLRFHLDVAMIIPSLCCLRFHLDDGSKSGLLTLLGWKMFARYSLASYINTFLDSVFCFVCVLLYAILCIDMLHRVDITIA